MRGQGRKAARTKRGGSGASPEAESSLLLALPVEVLHQVLAMLSPKDLIKLLQTSKAMAQEVMQCTEGRLTLNLQGSSKLAAVRQLLQGASSQSLKLMVDSGMAGPYTPLLSQPGQHMQQFPWISSVQIKQFKLSSLAPAGLVARCPSMHTLHLCQCFIDGSSYGGGSSSSSGASGSGAPGGSNMSSALHTLIVDTSQAPFLKDLPACNARVTRSMQSAAQQAEQLRRSLSGVTCLKLLRCAESAALLSVIGPQLQDLHLEERWYMPGLHSLGTGVHLQRLQKLVLPDALVTQAAEMELLLSLPSLTHLEVKSFIHTFQEDYSNRACKWQYLHIHMICFDILLHNLARLPLHSLTHPLKLGRKQEDNETLMVPLPTDQDSLASLEQLAQRLGPSGVQLLGMQLAWKGDSCDGFQVAPALTVIAPAFGPQPVVGLEYLTVDSAILQALVTVYGPSLKQLVLGGCDWVADMQAAWHAALSGLPCLVRLEVHTPADIVDLARTVAEAMAQQPVGRYIELVAYEEAYSSSEDLAAHVRDVAGHVLAGVDILAKDGVAKPYARSYERRCIARWCEVCLYITRKHAP